MLATPGALPRGPDWLFEVMWDGLRVLAEVSDGGVRLSTRAGRDVSAYFPELAGLRAVAPDVVFDGEVVLLDHGVPSFGALADRLHGAVPAGVAAARPVTYMVFDVLRLYGVDLTQRPLTERRATLERLTLDTVPAVALSPTYTDGEALASATVAQGMEGVVAKRRDGRYRPGHRDAGWVTVSHRPAQACVVGGWRPARGAPDRIGALLLGVPDGHGLRYVGQADLAKAGEAVQRILPPRLVPTTLPPFTDGLPAAAAAGVRWCLPVTVVEMAHDGWTIDGRLRDGRYRGLRDDLDPAQVRRE